MTLESLKARLLSDPETKAYYDELKPEFDKILEDMKKVRDSMATYEYKDYTVDIIFNTELNVYEGNSKETNVYLMEESPEKIEETFRDYVDKIVADLKYKNTRLLVYNTYFEEEGQLFGEFAKRDIEKVFFGKTVEEIKEQFEKYMDKEEANKSAKK